MVLSLGLVAEIAGGRLERGDPATPVAGMNTIAEAGPDEVTFLVNSRYKKFLPECRAAAVITDEKTRPVEGLAFIRCPNPYLGYTRIVERFAPAIPYPPPGVHAAAWVDPTAELGTDVAVGPHATIGKDVRLGDGTIVMSGVHIGEGTVIGPGSILYPNVVIREHCELGARNIICPGAVIGSDGFGYAPDEEGRFHKIPQIGNVVTGDDVEIGCNACIDRGALGPTRIARGVKIDNLVQIAHNVTIGEDTAMAAQVGISGSCAIGGRVQLAGQVGIAGHLRIGDRVVIGAQSGVSHDIPAGERWFGYPARPNRRAARIEAVVSSLPEMRREHRALLRRVEELERRIAELGDRDDNRGG
ncbi:UDP-3-O-(3-hydroxymyristoyl)glucosamine N-acyltransferase [bacterium]|nr:UDP-3-O-(3-hydroxymyristoyl)glucosamine N-acyltransferase [bacterium]